VGLTTVVGCPGQGLWIIRLGPGDSEEEARSALLVNLEERSLRSQANTYWSRVHSLAHVQIDIAPPRFIRPSVVSFGRPTTDPQNGYLTLPVQTSRNPDQPLTPTHRCFLWLEHDQTGAPWHYRCRKETVFNGLR
jgi:hypothetical protein